jgi:alkanesulfonate monooxygenase SsuD/methylene tetrahydromethanopterin reductase-like flavin-dependent oxidoreductase (luciferase family)
MRHALFLPIFEELAEPIAVARLAAEAEAAGWDGVFVWDHIAYRDVEAVADPWITLAAMACATRDIRIGPMVTPLPRRRPLKLAREIATLDRLSRGRVTVGVGIAGDVSRELSGTGEETDAKIRAAMLDEGLDVMTGAWTGPRLTHRGDHYVVDDLSTGPYPVQQPRPPIWVGLRYGNVAPLRRAARYDGVFPVLVRTPDQLAEVVAGVQAHREADAGPFDVAIGAVPGTDPAPYEAAGATWFLTSFSPVGMTVDAARGALQDGPPG